MKSGSHFQQQFLIYSFNLVYYISTVFGAQQHGLAINKSDYFEMPGLNIMVFHDFYPEGHQGGVSIIQNGIRVASNGDVRLEPAPGQWQPIPRVGQRTVDRDNLIISVPCSYPDPRRDRKGFNPIAYPDIKLDYTVRVKAEGASVRITVDLSQPLPAEWIGKVGFNLELFPGELFGKTFCMDDETGIFPQQLDGPMIRQADGRLEVKSMVQGERLVIAPEDDAHRMSITAVNGRLQLLDGRAHHNNGWFIVRSAIAEGATENAVEWLVAANVLPNWTYKPVIHVSQVGYLPGQEKVAFIESDMNDKGKEKVILYTVPPSGKPEPVLVSKPEDWGQFLRYHYRLFNFSAIQKSAMYFIEYKDSRSEPFKISQDVFDRHVWQPTLECFLPVQMCHMRVNDRYRVWHGLCHMDDALMAPTDTVHIDGYQQGSSTLTSYQPLQPVPGLNVGGWHDAGDFDLRIESQAGTVRILSLIYEEFKIDYDQTSIDQQNHVVEMYQPDGKPDILQQVEHGVLSVLAGYKNLGRLYRGIICPTVRQYVLLGDPVDMTDNKIYHATLERDQVQGDSSGVPDDRWVFTENNPARELFTAACLAAASRALKEYNPDLSGQCLQVAEILWLNNRTIEGFQSFKVECLAELLLTTRNVTYQKALIEMAPVIVKQAERTGWIMARVLPLLNDDSLRQNIADAIKEYNEKLTKDLQQNPFHVPFRPQIWGIGWDVQTFGVRQYYLHKAWPDIVPLSRVLDALNYVLGCHPGENTASFASGIGARSLLVAYGFNRADGSYIPGGVASGTALIRPDFPELKEWPYLWQQTEYVMGGGAENFMFLVLAAKKMLAVE